ncbi:hypothetical protein SAMN06265379_101661 [Saccharicrinis carchari]|uniref:Probable membrane transporter protein n=1 Tax=Saccharicrinis carchari TaxID=1168039 RepID=A0A521B3E2_SACCC|nr:sulfite exporter TauE/SafE family protein [Saccharicrinis carchari]SMO41612.1 hypothetical protein SAMN06265379_101661 [Saccharicrinis carchari]
MIFHSPVEPLYLLLPLIGLIVGLFGTVLGGGGGFFFLPVLTLIFNVPPQTAVLTSLVAALPIGMVGMLGHHKKGNIDFKVGWIFAFFGVLGTFLGAYITSQINPEQLKDYFGFYAIILAISVIYGTLKNNIIKIENIKWNFRQYIRKSKAAFFGLGGGTISGAFGTSGTGPVLAGLLSMQIPLKMVVGTSLMVVTVNAMSAITAHALVGQIDLTLIGFLTVGSVIGSIMGPKIVSKAQLDNKENKARYLYAVVLILIGLLMIIK